MPQVTEDPVATAVVLLSGGLDSSTTLAIAGVERGLACHALSVSYGQRHSSELDAAAAVARALGAIRHHILPLDLGFVSGSALLDERLELATTPAPGIPNTYVPARNTIFLALALAWAEVLEARQIFIGVNDVDYSGYPDCRPEYLQAFQRLADQATRGAVEGKPVKIHAPLLGLRRAQIIHRGLALGLDYSLTVSCYQADSRGRACGHCDSCRLRRKAFAEAGVADPTRYQKS